MSELNEGKGMSLEAYRGLIERFRGAGYVCKDYEDIDPKSPHLILRHDVDMCLVRALEMAELESKLGVRSCYFVLLNTELYNAGSTEGREILRNIARLGHEVGLHFDPAGIAEGDAPTLDAEVEAECEVLRIYAGREIRVVTFHRPAKWLMGYPGNIGCRIHGYQPRFFSDIGYCSDSEGRFRYHHPLEHPAFLAGHCLQLITHPIWWCASPGEGPVEKLVRYRREREGKLDAVLAANCKPFQGVDRS